MVSFHVFTINDEPANKDHHVDFFYNADKNDEFSIHFKKRFFALTNTKNKLRVLEAIFETVLYRLD